MVAITRHENRLMRQRGAGPRPLKSIGFGPFLDHFPLPRTRGTANVTDHADIVATTLSANKEAPLDDSASIKTRTPRRRRTARKLEAIAGAACHEVATSPQITAKDLKEVDNTMSSGLSTHHKALGASAVKRRQKAKTAFLADDAEVLYTKKRRNIQRCFTASRRSHARHRSEASTPIRAPSNAGRNSPPPAHRSLVQANTTAQPDLVLNPTSKPDTSDTVCPRAVQPQTMACLPTQSPNAREHKASREDSLEPACVMTMAHSKAKDDSCQPSPSAITATLKISIPPAKPAMLPKGGVARPPQAKKRKARKKITMPKPQRKA